MKLKIQKLKIEVSLKYSRSEIKFEGDLLSDSFERRREEKDQVSKIKSETSKLTRERSACVEPVRVILQTQSRKLKSKENRKNCNIF